DLALAAEGQRVLGGFDVDVCHIEARQLGLDQQRIALVVDVDCGGLWLLAEHQSALGVESPEDLVHSTVQASKLAKRVVIRRPVPKHLVLLLGWGCSSLVVRSGPACTTRKRRSTND